MSSDEASPPVKVPPSRRARVVRAFLFLPVVFLGVTLCAGFAIAFMMRSGSATPDFWFDIDRVALAWFNHNQCSFGGIGPLLLFLDRVEIPLSVILASPVLLVAITSRSRVDLYASLKRQDGGQTGLRHWFKTPISTAVFALLMGAFFFYPVFHGATWFSKNLSTDSISHSQRFLRYFCYTPVLGTSILMAAVSMGALFLFAGAACAIAVMDNAVRRGSKMIASILSRSTDAQ